MFVDRSQKLPKSESSVWEGKVGLAGRLLGLQRWARPLVGTFDRGPGSTVQWALGHWGSARPADACLHTVSSVAWLGRLEGISAAGKDHGGWLAGQRWGSAADTKGRGPGGRGHKPRKGRQGQSSTVLGKARLV